MLHSSETDTVQCALSRILIKNLGVVIVDNIWITRGVWLHFCALV